MSEKLLNCPFCGGEAKKGWCIIHCIKCYAAMQDPHTDEAAHVAMWNRRPALPLSQPRVEWPEEPSEEVFSALDNAMHEFRHHLRLTRLHEIYKAMRAAHIASAKGAKMGDLLECPFCGGEASYGECLSVKPITYFVNCTECLASTNQLSPCLGLPKEEAARQWNSRVTK